MPGPVVETIETDARPPDRADVAVIGGGIIGASTALELAERGLKVVLCEKGQIGGEQSSRNWGWVRISRRDPREVPLMAEALRMWEGLSERVGRDIGYRRAGIMFLAETVRSFEQNDAWTRHVQPHQIASRMLTPGEVREIAPQLETPIKGALYTSADGRAEPQRVAPAIAQAARARGAHVVTGCAVRALDLEAGRVAGIVTEAGRVKCSSVVLAGGAWSRLFAGNAGIALPQLGVVNTVMRTTPVDGPEAAIWGSDVAIRKRADGGYTLASGVENLVDIVPDSFRLARSFLPALIDDWRSLRFRLSDRFLHELKRPRHWRPSDITPFEQCRVLDPEPSQRGLRQVWKAARRAFPVFEAADVVQSWAGMIDVTPDAIPVISGVEAVPGLFISTGYSGHGFGIGPGAGRLTADLVAGDTPIVDPHEFRFSRFTDGSRIRIDHGY